MSVFVSAKDTANFSSNFVAQINPKSVQKTRSRALSGVKTLGLASTFQT